MSKLAYFDLPGLRMHAATAGPVDGPLVVLLHGFPQFWYAWRHQLSPLAEAGLRVVAPDQRGYNFTEKRGPYDIGTLVTDIVHLIRAQGRDGAHLVGHDWGAVVAWGLAAAHPELVETLTICNVPHPAAYLDALRGGVWRQWLASYYIGLFQIPALPERVLVARGARWLRAILTRTAAPATYTERDLEAYTSAWLKPGAMTAMLGWYRAAPRLTGPATRPYRGLVQAPTTIVWGERDVALDVRTAELSLNYVHDARLVRLPGVSHWVTEEQPEVVTAEVLRQTQI
jgi:pimeloyl-ACP methyl ester carboxylesterase